MSEQNSQGQISQGDVHLRIEARTAFVTFDRPSAHNAMTWHMYEKLAAALATINADASLRLAVFRGAGGKAFIAGTDIAQFTTFQSGDDGVAYEKKIDAYVSGLEALRVPTLAVIEGMAIGGGLAIANACDLRIATKGARFGVPIARTLGNCLSPNNLSRLTMSLGLSIVKRMLLLAELPTAEALEPVGYLAAITEPEALEETVKKISDRLLGHAPVTMRVTREMLRDLSLSAKDREDLIRECYGSQDFATGVRAFLAKQTAEWQGL